VMQQLSYKVLKQLAVSRSLVYSPQHDTCWIFWVVGSNGTGAPSKGGGAHSAGSRRQGLRGPL
jgi:hypothetical protein